MGGAGAGPMLADVHAGETVADRTARLGGSATASDATGGGFRMDLPPPRQTQPIRSGRLTDAEIETRLQAAMGEVRGPDGAPIANPSFTQQITTGETPQVTGSQMLFAGTPAAQQAAMVQAAGGNRVGTVVSGQRQDLHDYAAAEMRGDGRGAPVFLPQRQPAGAGAPVSGGGGGVRRGTEGMSVTTEDGVPISDEQRARIGTAFDAQAAAQQRAANARAAGMDRQAEEDRAVATQLREADKARQMAAEEQAAKVEEQMGQFGKAAQDVADLEVDPDRYMASKGTGGRIIAAIAMGLGAFAEGQGGGPNRALEIISKSIDDDIAAQQQQIAGRRAGLTDQRYLIEQMRAAGATAEEAALAARSAMLQRAELDTRSIASAATAEEQRAMGDQLAAQLAGQRETADIDLRARVQGRVQRTVTSQSQTVSGGGGGGGGRAGGRAGSAGAANAANGYSIPGAQVADEGRVAALSTTERGQAAKAVGGALAARDAMQEMIDIRSRSGVFSRLTDSDLQERARESRLSYVRALSLLEEAGALGDQERAGYEARVPDPTGWDWSQMVGGDRISSALSAQMHGLLRSANARLTPLGYRIGGGGGGTQGSGAAQAPASFTGTRSRLADYDAQE
ncbi:MAG: hypothetical protein ACRCU1_00355 [Alsobacter sp.]